MQRVLKLCGGYSCMPVNKSSSCFHLVATKHSTKEERRMVRWVILLLSFPWFSGFAVYSHGTFLHTSMEYCQHLLLAWSSMGLQLQHGGGRNIISIHDFGFSQQLFQDEYFKVRKVPFFHKKAPSSFFIMPKSIFDQQISVSTTSFLGAKLKKPKHIPSTCPGWKEFSEIISVDLYCYVFSIKKKRPISKT